MARRESTPEQKVQATVDAAEEKGYLGIGVDPTPNENYTVAGVLAGKPTPETDKAAAKAAADRQSELAADPFASK